MNQLDLAIHAGQIGMNVSLEAAERSDPDFKGKAQSAILSRLQVLGQATGEQLTDYAKLMGAIPSDDRAFGGVYAGLLKGKRIQVVGYAPRLKGHGSMGAKIYALVH
jgi:hypothetical protein